LKVLFATVELVIAKRETEVNDGKESESREEFTRNVISTTNTVLLSNTGWMEISNQSQKFNTASKIFR